MELFEDLSIKLTAAEIGALMERYDTNSDKELTFTDLAEMFSTGADCGF